MKILIVDPDPRTHEILTPWAERHRVELAATDDVGRALECIRSAECALVVADHELRSPDGGSVTDACRDAGIAVVLTAAFGNVRDAVVAMRSGAEDFVAKPFSAEQIEIAVERALEHRHLEQENRDLREALDDRLRIDNFVSTDPRMQQTLKLVRAVAPTRTTVLITGESGTGKTLLARAIHGASDRKVGPFVEVNCGALPENLLESELFGHVRGSFTGAIRDKAGKFECASGGTIFLDEIGTASQSLQVKLLRVLQDRVIERIGDTNSIEIDVRVILATNLDLEQAVADGAFREDLYYRINVVPMHVPPLRERAGDVRALAEHFLGRFTAEIGKPIRGISPDALALLQAAPWPGNVRQLENVIERAVVLAEGSTITADDLPTDLAGPRPNEIGPESLIRPGAHLLPLKQALEGPESMIIKLALEHHGGNRQRTAESLGINRSTLFNKMRKFDLL